VQPNTARGDLQGRHKRTAWSLPIFAFLSCLTFVLVPVVDPSASVALADPVDEEPVLIQPTQTVTAAEGVASTRPAREAFKITMIPKAPVYGIAPAAGVPDPGTAKAIAYEMVLARGWAESEYNCLVALWNKESGWNVFAHNKSSGAYGIPQSLPGEKMASVGADWATNPATQITWGLGYIGGRYQTPCGAWATSQQKGWY